MRDLCGKCASQDSWSHNSEHMMTTQSIKPTVCVAALQSRDQQVALQHPPTGAQCPVRARLTHGLDARIRRAADIVAKKQHDALAPE